MKSDNDLSNASPQHSKPQTSINSQVDRVDLSSPILKFLRNLYVSDTDHSGSESHPNLNLMISQSFPRQSDVPEPSLICADGLKRVRWDIGNPIFTLKLTTTLNKIGDMKSDTDLNSVSP